MWVAVVASCQKKFGFFFFCSGPKREESQHSMRSLRCKRKRVWEKKKPREKYQRRRERHVEYLRGHETQNIAAVAPAAAPNFNIKSPPPKKKKKKKRENVQRGLFVVKKKQNKTK